MALVLRPMRIVTALATAALAFLLAAAPPQAADDAKVFLGKWNIHPVEPKGSHAWWLEVKKDGDKLVGDFLNRGGSVTPLADIKVQGGELLLWPKGRNPPDPAQPYGRGRVVRGKLEITFTGSDGKVHKALGERPPAWKKADASRKHRFGKPVVLFDGRSLDAFTVQDPDKPSGWSVVDGILVNEPKANNLVSKQRFKDFKIEAEYRIEKGSNSGLYLRGRYELQILDDHGRPAESHGHMGIYSRVAPATNAGKPAGEWQTVEAVIVGNRVTVIHNGQKVHDNVVLDGITGGALDAREAEPGPIMFQGDHGKVEIRKVVVTPIRG